MKSNWMGNPVHQNVAEVGGDWAKEWGLVGLLCQEKEEIAPSVKQPTAGAWQSDVSGRYDSSGCQLALNRLIPV